MSTINARAKYLLNKMNSIANDVQLGTLLESLETGEGDAAVIAQVLTGYSAGSGAVSAADSILSAIQKVDGNSANAAVIARLLTGYASGTAGAVVALSATDSILAAIQKLDGNKPPCIEATASLTFDHSVGAKTVIIMKLGKVVHLHVPAGAISDGVGTACAATAVAAAYRPAAACTHSIMVIDNGTTRKAGQVVVGSDGVMTLSVLGTGFTNAAAAGWDAFSVMYTTAT